MTHPVIPCTCTSPLQVAQCGKVCEHAVPEPVQAILLTKIAEAILLTPITSAFRASATGSEESPPAADAEMVVAIQADRFELLARVRDVVLKHSAGAPEIDCSKPAWPLQPCQDMGAPPARADGVGELPRG
jgi:hypothetical protein